MTNPPTSDTSDGIGICRECAIRVHAIYRQYADVGKENSQDCQIDLEDVIHEAMFRAKFCTCPCLAKEK